MKKIVEGADAEKDFMGLFTFKGTQPTLVEARTAKNYLDEKELRAMEHATNEYRKYKQRTISDVEQDYLNSIKRIDNMGKKGGYDED